MEKVLILTLHKLAFDVMVSGEKRMEYRENSKWIRSRLFDSNGMKRDYDFVLFKNGYSKMARSFKCFFFNSYISPHSKVVKYSNGLTVNVVGGETICIVLGKIVEKLNL